MASGKSRILIVDDNNLFGVSLSDVLNRQPGLSVCRISAGGKDIVEIIKRDNPDLAIVSLALETTSWLDLIKTIASEYPDTRVLAYSPFDRDVCRVERAMVIGARGCVTRSSSMKEFLSAVRKVLRGELHMSRDMEERLMNRVRRKDSDRDKHSPSQLSDREYEVFLLLGDGYTARAIAEKLSISVKTIQTHKERIKKKMSVADCPTLLRCAIAYSRDGQFASRPSVVQSA